jgi:hypothetical protein
MEEYDTRGCVLFFFYSVLVLLAAGCVYLYVCERGGKVGMERRGPGCARVRNLGRPMECTDE